MRTLFLGGTQRGYRALRTLIDAGAEVCGVISLEQHEHETERFEEPIRELAERHKIPHVLTKWMKDRDYASLLAEWKPDVAFAVGCRILMPPEIYNLPKRGTLAVHDSLLPEYRGFAPLNWAVLNGESSTGVTLFFLDDRTDGGDIVSQIQVPIGADETAAEVYEKVCAATEELLRQAVAQMKTGELPRIPQDYSQGSFSCSRSPEDGEIHWERPTREIYNLVRALSDPYPGAFTWYRGSKLTVWKARPVDDPPLYAGRIPGRIVEVSRQSGEVRVLTGDGILTLHQVQLAREEPKPAAVVLTSVREALGLSRSDLLERIESLERQLAAARAGRA
jgi:methionyl-tRNA formyltransferase